MTKVRLGPKTFLYPMPTTLVGSNVDDRPNYLVVVYCSIVNHDPAFIAVALNRSHHTNIGIRQNRTFSVNIPSKKMVQATDYCGIFSGERVDKSKIFTTFYGRLKTAPMIKECPLNLECKVIQTLEFSMDEVFIGEIVESYSQKQYLTKGLPDIRKIKPIIFSMHDNNYWSIGRHIGRAWSIGEKFNYKKK